MVAFFWACCPGFGKMELCCQEMFFRNVLSLMGEIGYL